MKINRDSWLSEIFDYSVFRVIFEEMPEDEESLRVGLRKHFDSQVRALYFARIGTSQIALIQKLCVTGFYVVDDNVALAMRISDMPQFPSGAVIIESDELNSEQQDELLEIATSCFRYSRFHLDPQVPDVIANEIKRRWIENYVYKKRGEKLFVALQRGRPAGFLAAMTVERQSRPHGVIDMIGIGPKLQGHGFGIALVKHFVNHYRGITDSVLVGTQAANIPSLRFYAKCGFLPVETSYVLHAHVFGDSNL